MTEDPELRLLEGALEALEMAVARFRDRQARSGPFAGQVEAEIRQARRRVHDAPPDLVSGFDVEIVRDAKEALLDLAATLDDVSAVQDDGTSVAIGQGNEVTREARGQLRRLYTVLDRDLR